MKITKIFKLVLVACCLVLAAGCSSNKHAGAQVTDADGSDGYASGLGKRTGFGAQDVEGVNYTTKAPHDQIYYFEFNMSDVKPKYLPSIQAQARYLVAHPSAHILIAGNTDERGSREYNVALGERRANSVAEIMRLAGVPSQQIRVVSYGQERPASLGHDESAYSLNRRVELTYEAK